MALDPMIVGCDWQATLIVEPTAGRTVADVSADLGAGATVAVRLIDAGGVVKATGATSSITSASERTIEAIFTRAELARVAPGIGHVLDVRVTTPGPSSKIRPVQVREKIEVRAFTAGV